jgi:hypothetical protein
VSIIWPEVAERLAGIDDNMTPRHLCVLTIHFARLIFTRFSSAAVGRKQANLVHSSFTSAAVGEEANLIALDMHYPVNNNIQLKISLGSHFCSSSHLSMGCIHKQKNPSQEPCTHAQSFRAGSPRALTDEAVAMRALIFPQLESYLCSLFPTTRKLVLPNITVMKRPNPPRCYPLFLSCTASKRSNSRLFLQLITRSSLSDGA